MSLINEKCFEDFDDFGFELVEEYDKYKDVLGDEFWGVSVVAHYDIIKSALTWLIANTDFEICDIELRPFESDYYGDEWILSISPQEDIWCCKAKSDKGYLDVCGGLIYVHSNVNSKFVITNQKYKMIEFCIGDEESDDDYTCDECNLDCCECDHENNELQSDSNIKVTYVVNGKEVDKETFNRYAEGINKELIGYCEFLDEMDEWSNILRW